MQQVFEVRDGQGAPVVGALLQAVSSNGNWQAVTDSGGQFVANLGAGVYVVTATKNGVTTAPQSVNVGPVQIVLQAASVPVPQPAQKPTAAVASKDAIDLSSAVLTSGSPDVRAWPIGSHLTEITLDAESNMGIDFSKRNGPQAWPFLDGPEGGDIQYTLWIGCLIGGVWHLAGSILCISRSPSDNYVPTGPALQPGQLPKNWYYFAGSPMATYQPKPGEQVAWFLTSGVQRRNDMHVITERTQVVLTPFSAGTYTF
jgi:hypothetical protein